MLLLLWASSPPLAAAAAAVAAVAGRVPSRGAVLLAAPLAPHTTRHHPHPRPPDHHLQLLVADAGAGDVTMRHCDNVPLLGAGGEGGAADGGGVRTAGRRVGGAVRVR